MTTMTTPKSVFMLCRKHDFSVIKWSRPMYGFQGEFLINTFNKDISSSTGKVGVGMINICRFDSDKKSICRFFYKGELLEFSDTSLIKLVKKLDKFFDSIKSNY